MLRVIEEYWQQLNEEFAAVHPDKEFLRDYEHTLPYLRRFEEFLSEALAEHPADVDIACYLVSARLACRSSEEQCIELLETFMSENEAVLSDVDRARILTNLGFYTDEEKQRKRYLHRAADCGSPFVQTYKGLGLAYFSTAVDGEAPEDIVRSIEAFEHAMIICGDYEYAFDYAVSLFHGKRLTEAVKVFEALLAAHPDRPRLLVALAYCQIYLGNKALALEYLNRAKHAESMVYPLSSDDVDPLEVINVYYALEDYKHFVSACEEVLDEYSLSAWDHYFYALWVTGRGERFQRTVQAHRDEFLQTIAEAQSDQDFKDELQRREYIDSYEADLQALESMVQRIQEEHYMPGLDLNLYPEYSCFLIDCIRHTL